MPTVTLGPGSHSSLTGVAATQHHTATVGGDINLADLAVRAHANLSDAPADAHHATAHTPESHTNQGATAAELETLTDGSSADSLHAHPATGKVATGTFTGDGAISQAITGIGFQTKFVQIWQRETTVGNLLDTRKVILTTAEILDDDASGGAIMEGSGDTFEDDAIIALGADGFTVDDNAANDAPNASSVVYNFLALG